MLPKNALSHGAVIAGRVALAVGALAAVATVFLMFSRVSSGPVDCGKLVDYPTSEYVSKELPIPVDLSGCEQALDSQASRVTVARNSVGILFGIAIMLSLSAKPLRRAESGAAAA